MQEMQEMRVWSLDREDALEKKMATHSSTLACKNPMDRGPVGYSPLCCKESGMTEHVCNVWTRLLYCWKRVFAMFGAFSWQNLVSLCPASFCSPKSNLPVTLAVLDFLLFHSKPQGWIELFLVLVLGGLLGFLELINFSFLGISGRGIDFNYCDIEWLALETNQDHFVIFEVAPKNCILNCKSVFCWLWGLLHFLVNRYDFSFYEFTEACFMVQGVIYPCEYSKCSWEGSIFCYFWMEYPTNIN